MKVTRFDTGADLAIIGARAWGPRGDKLLTLALDTASTETLVGSKGFCGIASSDRGRFCPDRLVIRAAKVTCRGGGGFEADGIS